MSNCSLVYYPTIVTGMLWYKTIANANYHPILVILLMNYFGFNPFPDLTPVQNFDFGNSEFEPKLKFVSA